MGVFHCCPPQTAGIGGGWFAASLLPFFLALPAAAQDALSSASIVESSCVGQRQMLTFGYYSDFRPVSYAEKTGAAGQACYIHRGYEADLLTAVEAMEDAGLSFRRRDVGVVVDDEGGAGVGAEGAEVAGEGKPAPFAVVFHAQLDGGRAAGDRLLRDLEGIASARERRVNDDVEAAQALRGAASGGGRGGEFGARHRVGEVGEMGAVRRVGIERRGRLGEGSERADQGGVEGLQPARPLEARDLFDGAVYRGERVAGEGVQSEAPRRL